ncbi:MAG: tetratricopeptide repeat protein [Calditrichaceae bacterium]|nr:tetratricopeptide repeat protein [Calditrichaceae bacterium]MBN2707921.1 tetratricopeptide repeat protein [Calditrichaceae bacterium]
MIRSVILFIIFIFSTGLASEWESAFEEGNQLYRKGQYEQAIEVYESIIKNGMESGELYYNLGNAYYKTNQIGEARLNYERAAQFLKNDEALKQNLELVKLQLVDQIIIPPKFILIQWWDQLLNVLSLNILTWITILLLFLVLTSSAVLLYLRTRRGRLGSLRMIQRIILIIFIIFLVLLLNKIYVFETEEFAIILKPSVTIHASPDSKGTEVFILHEGTKVRLMRGEENWYEIRLDDGKTGWLEKNNVEKI